jgi:hypothetical protein
MSQNGNLTPNHKPLQSKDQMSSNWGVLYIVEFFLLMNIKYGPYIFKTNLIWERYERPKFWDKKSPNFGTPRKKWHLDVVPMERHIIYYKEGSGGSSQKLQVV